MKVAVLSGKGGSGKTFAAVNLAALAQHAVYADCDVEEPNGHLFLRPCTLRLEEVCVPVPRVDTSCCPETCRVCVDFCKFNALARAGASLLVFDEICHSCGGCSLLCPAGAIKEIEKQVGFVSSGVSSGITVHSGMLNTGEPSGVPIVKAVLAGIKEQEKNTLVLIDCAPGTACVVMESIKDADYCLLVAEPTVFGAENLRMAMELVTLAGKPHGVLLNKCLAGERNPSEELCKAEGVSIAGSIPYSREFALLNADGKIAVRENADAKRLFGEVLQRLVSKVFFSPDAAWIAALPWQQRRSI